ncbi:MAG: type IX secretion system membrane protein PorP/SprF [bacterium]
MMYWLRTISIFCFCGALIQARAQQRPHYTQYIMNNYIINPAISGIENYVDVKLSARNQWVGIEGAPKTFYGTVHGAIGKKGYKASATSFEMKGQNPRGREYWSNYKAAEPHHGVGLTVVNYQTGYINRLTSYATYAYHIGLSSQTSLAAGFGAGFSSINVNRTRITLATEFDPAIGTATSQLTQLKPELNAGLWLYSSSFFAGISAQQIIPVRLQFVESDSYRSNLLPHLFATAGYRFPVGQDISLLPSFMMRYIVSTPLAADLNLKAQYRDLMWTGVNFRNADGFAAMVGINVAQTFNISYSYDFNRGKYLLSTMNRGTHEIVLGFTLGNSYGDLCPRNIW